MNAIRRDDGTIVVKGGLSDWLKWIALMAGIMGTLYRGETKTAVTFTKIESRLDVQDKTNEQLSATNKQLSETVENLKQSKTDIEVVKQQLRDGDRRFDGVDRSLDQVNDRLDEISRQVRGGGT